MKRLGAILVWSAIAAAFIGPGTVTTAASAGASFGTALLWAVLFSAVATFVLQEAAARLTIATGSDLAEVLRQRFPSGFARTTTLALAGGAILIGSIAYEAGNILGGVAGAQLAVDRPKPVLTLATALTATAMLAYGSPAQIARCLAGLVALIGFGFLAVAIVLAPPVEMLLTGLVVPAIPDGGAVMVIALIGTTVVPYNLFLGSSLARGSGLGETRFGLAVAIAVGALITAGIVVVGSALDGEFSFERLDVLLSRQVGEWAGTGLAIGLFAAGLSSATTAPLAAAITVRGLIGDGADPRWGAAGWRFRSVWIAVLAIGVLLGVAGIRPVPAIVMAQALNGLFLPIVAVFLLLAMRDPALLGRAANGLAGNIAMVLVTGVATMLGAVSLFRVFATVLA